MLNISFPALGTYTIICQAQNLLSMARNSTTIIVQDIITNFTLHAGNITNFSTSQPLEVARFQIRMATGSNYVCTINYDRSQTVTYLYYYTYGYIPGSYVTYQYLQEGQYNVSQNSKFERLNLMNWFLRSMRLVQILLVMSHIHLFIMFNIQLLVFNCNNMVQ
jgi:hypothetical protein